MNMFKKLTGLGMAVMMMAATAMTSMASYENPQYTQDKYFYTDAAATTASYMGHGCIRGYDVETDGTVKIYLQSEEYARGGVTYTGYITALTVAGQSESGLYDGSTFEVAVNNKVNAVTFNIMMENEDGDQTPHPAISGYLKLDALSD